MKAAADDEVLITGTGSHGLVGGSNYPQALLEQLQADYTEAKEAFEPMSIQYAVSGGDGTNTFTWELRSRTTDARGRPLGWSDLLAVRPSALRLEIEAGADEKNFHRLTVMDQVATRGRVPLSLPPGTKLIRARLVRPDGSAGADAAGAAVVEGPIALVGTGENLLFIPRPSLEHPPAGLPELDGWSGLRMAQARREPGGPAADGQFLVLPSEPSYRIMAIAPGVTREIASAQIPIDPAGAGYLFSGWVSLPASSTGGILLRFFDREGKMTGSGTAWSPNPDNRWYWFSKSILPGPNRNPREVIVIPPGSAFLQIVVTTMLPVITDVRLAGLELRQLAR